MRIKLILAASVICLSVHQLSAQGCSDAGFCTLNSMKPHLGGDAESYKNQVKIGTSYGKADHAISTWGAYIEYNRMINEKFGVDLKVTSLGQSGSEISTFGLSDLFATANYKATDKLSFTLGAKVPLSDANRKEHHLPLPLDYQSSLGTFDLIVGVGYQVEKLQLMAAYQQPLTHNGNQFLAAHADNSMELMGFQSTNGYKRSGDVLLRAAYPFMVCNRLRITPSLLPIYHLANDKYTDALNVEREITGSKGLTLNGNLFVDYDLNATSALQLSVGAPFITREARPDGLARSFVVNLEYRVKF